MVGTTYALAYEGLLYRAGQEVCLCLALHRATAFTASITAFKVPNPRTVTLLAPIQSWWLPPANPVGSHAFLRFVLP